MGTKFSGRSRKFRTYWEAREEMEKTKKRTSNFRDGKVNRKKGGKWQYTYKGGY